MTRPWRAGGRHSQDLVAGSKPRFVQQMVGGNHSELRPPYRRHTVVVPARRRRRVTQASLQSATRSPASQAPQSVDSSVRRTDQTAASQRWAGAGNDRSSRPPIAPMTCRTGLPPPCRPVATPTRRPTAVGVAARNGRDREPGRSSPVHTLRTRRSRTVRTLANDKQPGWGTGRCHDDSGRTSERRRTGGPSTREHGAPAPVLRPAAAPNQATTTTCRGLRQSGDSPPTPVSRRLGSASRSSPPTETSARSPLPGDRAPGPTTSDGRRRAATADPAEEPRGTDPSRCASASTLVRKDTIAADAPQVPTHPSHLPRRP